MRPSEAIETYRNEIIQIVRRNSGQNVRVFGSTIRGEDTESSDLDLLIDPTATTSLFSIAKMELELSRLLEARVEIKTPNGLPKHFRQEVINQAYPLKTQEQEQL